MRVNISEQRGAWITDYRAKDDITGRPRRWIKRHQNKRAAEAYAKAIEKEHDQGTHTPVGKSPTLKQAGADWLQHVKVNPERQQSTWTQYEQHLRLHILPGLGEHTKLSEISRPRIERFKDRLLERFAVEGNSPATARKVLRSLSSLFNEAMRVGLAAHNPVRGVKIEVKKRPLEVGRDIPTVDEVKRMMDKAPTELSRTVVIVAAFTGMRSSELRGLRWSDIEFKANRINVRQAVTRQQIVKGPKSEAGRRAIPVMRIVVNTLREWKAAHGQHELVLTKEAVGPRRRKSLASQPLDQTSILKKGVTPAVEAAGLLDHGKPRYDLLSLRHFYASLCCNSVKAGGFELPLKEIATRMGHTDPAFTLRTYGHLLPARDEAADLKAAEKRIFGG
jgi:integrase